MAKEMSEDNMYPVSSEFFGLKIPEDQKKDAKQEKDEVHSNLKLVNALIDHLEQRVEFYNSVDSIEIDSDMKPEAFMRNFAANQLVKKNLEAELYSLQSIIATHQK